LILVVLMYVGFFASGVVLGGQALAAWLGLGFMPAAIGLSAVITVLSIYGYWAIHRLERILSIIAFIAFLFLTYRMFAAYDVGAAWHGGAASPGTFLLILSIAATWQITYAPYVADYSRYLPEDTPIAAAFWWSYSGTVISTVWMMSVGAIAAAVAGNTFHHGSSDFFVDLAPHALRPVASGVIVLGIVATNVLNLYGVFMSTTTTLTAIFPFRVDRRTRAVITVTLSSIGTALGIFGQGDFVTNLENLILFLAYFLIPWTAINLADFYWIRKEKYDLRAIFNPDGLYGRVNWRTMIAYLAAIAAEIPFMSTTFYTGPAVALMGGADIAWIVGLVIAAGLYVALMRPVIAAEAR
jgi:NCS1 family nucleobase:cation symporter-1